MDMEIVSEDKQRAGQVRVLVVDDHPSAAATLSRAISHLGRGIDTLYATSGRQAVEFAGDSAIDILITDMMMPEMNGLELIEHMQKHPAGRPACTILMTAYDVPGLKETARRLNIDEVLIKPVPPERVCHIVSRVLDNSGIMANAQPLSNAHSPFNILIADDYPDNISLLSRYLKIEGYRFAIAHDGIETLEKARAEMPDLILLDVNMPGKDGMKVLQELRADPATEHIPVIILSAARISPADVQHGLNLGADDYITKPFDRLELLARIRTKLRVKSAEDRIRRRNRELSVLPEIGRELSARLDLDEISSLVLKRSVEALGAISGHIFILNLNNPYHREYHITRADPVASQKPIPLHNGLIEEMKLTRESILIEDTENDPRWPSASPESGQSVLIVPIIGRFDLVGLILLVHERKFYFNADHLILTQAIASQAGIALENCRLYNELSKEEERISALLNSAADGILMFGADGCLSILNPTAKNLFPGEDAKPGLPLPRNQNYETLIASIEQSFDHPGPHVTEIAWHDGRVFSAHFTPLEDGGCVLLLHDVSHFKALERVKDEFIATASHDLKNPLTTIRGYSELLLQRNWMDETQTDFVRRIQHASGHMAELVDNMLDLAKMDLIAEVDFHPVELFPILAQVADEFRLQAASKNQALAFDVVEGRGTIWGDSLKLRQAFANLVGNAVKYTPAKGSIRISMALQERAIQVSVCDTGYGIPPSEVPHIFDRFYRVRNHGLDEIEGTGLGLAIVKSVIDAHGGQVSVESEPGKGTCFTCTLPLMQEGLPPFASQKHSQPDPIPVHQPDQGKK